MKQDVAAALDSLWARFKEEAEPAIGSCLERNSHPLYNQARNFLKEIEACFSLVETMKKEALKKSVTGQVPPAPNL